MDFLLTPGCVPFKGRILWKVKKNLKKHEVDTFYPNQQNGHLNKCFCLLTVSCLWGKPVSKGYIIAMYEIY